MVPVCGYRPVNGFARSASLLDDLAELFLVAANAVGDGFDGGPQCCDVVGEAGEGSGVCGAVTVFLDEARSDGLR
jgi:hypothetical protein